MNELTWKPDRAFWEKRLREQREYCLALAKTAIPVSLETYTPNSTKRYIEVCQSAQAQLVFCEGQLLRLVAGTVTGALISTNGPMNDETPMPWGAHKGKPLANVPDHYLVWLYNQITAKREDLRSQTERQLLAYVLENADSLKITKR